MQPNGMIFWDWNGTLMDDVDFTHGCLNWMLESHGYPQRYDLAQYRELFRFPIEDYYRLAGFDFPRHPYPMLAEHFMTHYNAGVDACPVMAHAVDTLTELARRGWKQAVLSASRRDYLIEQVAARGLQGFFTELLGLADIYGVSKVQLGTDYLRRTGIDPAHCVMIGDTQHDAHEGEAGDHRDEGFLATGPQIAAGQFPLEGGEGTPRFRLAHPKTSKRRPSTSKPRHDLQDQ